MCVIVHRVYRGVAVFSNYSFSPGYSANFSDGISNETTTAK